MIMKKLMFALVTAALLQLPQHRTAEFRRP
jgi:hypothetical protein